MNKWAGYSSAPRAADPARRPALPGARGADADQAARPPARRRCHRRRARGSARRLQANRLKAPRDPARRGNGQPRQRRQPDPRRESATQRVRALRSSLRRSAPRAPRSSRQSSRQAIQPPAADQRAGSRPGPLSTRAHVRASQASAASGHSSPGGCSARYRCPTRTHLSDRRPARIIRAIRARRATSTCQ